MVTTVAGAKSDLSLRWPARMINSVMGAFDRFRSTPLFTMDKASVLRWAKKEAGIHDFECGEFGEPLQRWCNSSSDERLSPIGRLNRRTVVRHAVTTRLLIEKALRADPAIVQEDIEKPWFITGLPRSGTTLLHRLLGQDSSHRVPLFWELMMPFPQGRMVSPEQRKSAIDGVLKAANLLMADYATKHETRADLADECRFLLSKSLLVGTSWPVPLDFAYWLANCDRTPAYRLHKFQLQYLQRGKPRATWVLKDPEHLLHIDSLLEVYPDARIIKLHRDPVQVLPSLASLMSTLMLPSVYAVDKEEVGRDMSIFAKQLCFSRFNTPEGEDELRARGVPFVNVRYTDLVKNPLKTVASIYSQFGCELTNSTRQSMELYLEANPQKKHGTHRYTLGDFGLDEAVIRSEFKTYVERYLEDRPHTSTAVPADATA